MTAFKIPVVKADVRSMAVVLLLLTFCLLLLQLLWGFDVWSLFCYVVLCVHSYFESDTDIM